MSWRWAATCGSWAIGIAATRNMDPLASPAGRFTPYMASVPRVAIHAANVDPATRWELAGIGKGLAEVATTDKRKGFFGAGRLGGRP